MKLLRYGMVALALISAVPAVAQNQPTSIDMQILAEKVKADKKALVAANMQLTEREAKGFWPLYDSYQHGLHQIKLQLLATIDEYAGAYSKGSMDDATAKKLLNRVLAIHESELKLQQTYIPRLEKVLPEVKVARYIQIENKILALVHYQLAAGIPLVE
jgi:hypothetical protein